MNATSGDFRFAVSSDHYVVILTSSTDGVSNSVNVVLTSGELDGSLNYHIRMNDTVDWLFVTPATGSLSANSSQTLTFSLRNIGLSEGESLEATILVRFDDGLSVPITVRAEAP